MLKTKGMKHIWIYIVIFGLMACSTKKEIKFSGNPTVDLQNILEDGYNESNNIVGISLAVKSPDLDIDYVGSVGYDGLDKTNALKAEQPFRIASLTKVFVAAAIMRLYEKQLLSLNDPISKFISKEHVELLRSGGYDPDKITVRQCLNHTSGLYDYAEGGPEYIEEAAKNPSKRWTRTEQIQFAMDYGKPYALPGQEEHYSDTGYILLGEVIEKQSQSGLAEGLRELLKFDELGMTTTYLESLEEQPKGLLPNVKRYLENTDVSTWDNSMDLYGGGGLVSNTHDLTIFLQALFNGKIFDNEETLAIMLLENEYEGTDQELPAQRLGFTSMVGKKSKLVAFLHTGFWSTVFMHIPAYNTSIALNNTKDGDSEVLQYTLDYIIELGKEKK